MSRPPFHVRLAYWVSGRLRHLDNLWHRFVEPIEWLFSYCFGSLLDAFNSFEALESVVIRFISNLLWPFVKVGRWIGERLPSDPTGTGWISLPQRTAWRIARGTFALTEKFNLDRGILFCIWLLTPIWWPIATLLGFINAWITTRQTREMVLAVPALLLAAPFAYIAIVGTMQSQGKIASNYKVAVRNAVEAGDHSLVNLLERKLAQLGIDTRRTDYRTAVSLANNGNLGSAYQRMQRLAPTDSAGYIAAHVWIVQQLLSGDLTETEEPALADEQQRFSLAEQHLEHLRKLKFSAPSLYQMQAYVYAKTDRLPEAAETLAPISDTTLEIASMQLRLLLTLKQNDKAHSQARTVLELIEKNQQSERTRKKTLKTEAHETRVLAAQLAGDERLLRGFLNSWHKAEATNPRPTELLAALRRSQVEKLFASETSNPASAVEQLGDAVRLGSSPQWIVSQLEKISTQRVHSHTAQLIWEGLLTSPDVPNEVLQAAATTAAAQGDIIAARDIFEQLVNRGENKATTWNNYAWTLLQEPTPDPTFALETVNKAIELLPNEHRFRETRGQVLTKLQKWAAAIRDLEYALNRMPESPEIHRSLAKCYEALGQTELANIHRDQIP